MQLQLRPYQRAAVDALFDYFQCNQGNPLVVLPTGAGKSVVQAAFIAETLARWPTERFLLVSHVRELLTQNASHLAGAALYSAGLGRREIGRVTVAGVQSCYRRAHEFGDVGIVIIDEAHLVSKTAHTMYRRFLGDLTRLCPHVKVVGLSATPYRLDSGPLHRGSERLFTDIAYQISMLDLIPEYLSPLTTAPTKSRADTAGVAKRGGEFIAGDLERAMMGAGNTAAALAEARELAADRRHWLVFCSGVKHSAEVAAQLPGSRVVVGDTPSAERTAVIDAFRAGAVPALVSVGVLTTGFDAPRVDAVICLRPTMSPGLWVQMCGRGGRKAPGKTDCLVLDFTSNSQTHGPVDLITMDGDGEVKGQAAKICEGCGALMDPRVKACVACGWHRTRECWQCREPYDATLTECPDCSAVPEAKPREPKHADHSYGGAILSIDDAPLRVTDWWLRRHEKVGGQPSMRVGYFSGTMEYTEWICFEHAGYARQKASAWWVRRGGLSPAPQTVDEALSRQTELAPPTSIRVGREGKYWRVIAAY